MSPSSIDTPISRMLGIRYHIISAPMFLVSNVDLVVAVGEAGGIAAFPSLNFRPVEEFRLAIREIRKRTKQPFGVNLVMKLTPRFEDDLKVDSISTAKLLQLAANAGTQILAIDKSNIDALLPPLPFDDAVKQDIANAAYFFQVLGLLKPAVLGPVFDDALRDSRSDTR